MLDAMNDSQRAAREREAYNRGISREGLDKALQHAGEFFQRKTKRVLTDAFQSKNSGTFLEFGSTGWIDWINGAGIRPGHLTCINISERELSDGIKAAENTAVKPEFRLMDAHKLEFSNNSFDVVYGSGILHHLDLPVALAEVDRVLRPGGLVAFHEPLRMNPVALVVRKLTPKARTEDEHPLGTPELKALAGMFDVTFYYNQLFSVPMSLISRRLFRSPSNWFMRSAYRTDEALVGALPFLGPYYRDVVIVGTKKSSL